MGDCRTAGAAVVAIDLHRGHLDPAVVTMPLAADRAERVVAANARFLRDCRAAGIPIVHRGDFLGVHKAGVTSD